MTGVTSVVEIYVVSIEISDRSISEGVNFFGEFSFLFI